MATEWQWSKARRGAVRSGTAICACERRMKRAQRFDIGG